MIDIRRMIYNQNSFKIMYFNSSNLCHYYVYIVIDIKMSHAAAPPASWWMDRRNISSPAAASYCSSNASSRPPSIPSSPFLPIHNPNPNMTFLPISSPIASPTSPMLSFRHRITPTTPTCK